MTDIRSSGEPSILMPLLFGFIALHTLRKKGMPELGDFLLEGKNRSVQAHPFSSVSRTKGASRPSPVLLEAPSKEFFNSHDPVQ
jgi:hypothetical protein